MTERIAIIDGVRTPFCKVNTDFSDYQADQLGALPVREIILRTGINDIDEVIVGNCAQPAHAANVGRVIALRAGVPKHVPAITVHRNCASGMEAITTGAQRLQLGQADVICAAGVESMSNIPLLFNKKMTRLFGQLFKSKTVGQRLKTLLSFRPSFLAPIIGLKVGLIDPICNQIMGQTAENLAREFHISREEQDQFALQSHLNALKAQEAAYFDDEIMPVQLATQYDYTVCRDNGPRDGQSIEALKKLKPFFDRRLGSVTVGSSSQITDGAAAVILMREDTAKQRGLKPLGYLSHYAYAGCDPHRMGLGPAYATSKVCNQSNLKVSDFELIEINEAFAAQVLANVAAFESKEFAKKELGRDTALGAIPMDRLNVNGGSIALGHPLGATGMRLVITLLKTLHRREMKRGLASLCVGGGQGASMILETE